MKIAKTSGSILSYDPNLRLPLWPSPEFAREEIMSIWDQADVIKVALYMQWKHTMDIICRNIVFCTDNCKIWQISEEEITFLTGGDNPYDDNVVLNKLFHPNNKLLIVTEGSQGCRYYTQVMGQDLFNFLTVGKSCLKHLLFLQASTVVKVWLSLWLFFLFVQKFKGRVAGVKAKSVDTTGAGDAFVGGFLYCLASDLNLYKVRSF